MDDQTNRTALSMKLEAAMEDKNVSINDVSRAVGPAYEYIRRMLRGTSIPSDYVLKVMCEYFGWDFKETQQMVISDRIRIKHGKMGLMAQGINPETEPFNLAWPYITDSQKSFLLSQLNDFLTLNGQTIARKTVGTAPTPEPLSSPSKANQPRVVVVPPAKAVPVVQKKEPWR